MKKGIKIGLISAITLLSGSTLAAQAGTTHSASFVEKVCSYVPLACSVSLEDNGGGLHPKKPPEVKS